MAEPKQTADEKDDCMKVQLVIEWQELQQIGLQSHKSNHRKSKKVDDQIKSKQHSKKNEVEETKKNYQFADTEKVMKGSVTGGCLYGAASYVAVTAADGLAVEAAIAVGATVGGAVMFAGFAAAVITGYTMWRNKAEEIKLCNKQKYNMEIKLFNEQLKKLKDLTKELEGLNKELQEQENKINNKTFQMERHGPFTKLLVVIGPTGYGKSLVGNRLMGDKREIFDLAQTKDAIFDVASFGDTKSNTKELVKKSKRVIIIIGDDKNKREFVLSVVDTQGAFDSDGNDNHFLNEMAEYFGACGGVNMFCIFFKFGTKNDKNYKDLLKLYATFWGEKFWKKCVIIITNCDRDSKKNIRTLDVGLPKTIKDIKEFLHEISNGIHDNVPIYQFGEENFESSTFQLLSSLENSQSIYNTKYKCDKIKSPMDTLWDKIKPKTTEIESLNKQLATLNFKIQESEAEISK